MSKKPRVRISLIEKKGDGNCHRGHKVGDSFDFETERGKLCPMAMHVAFPYVDILRYGGSLPLSSNGDIRFCCPDADIINVFRLTISND